jgi:hypothetical protein
VVDEAIGDAHDLGSQGPELQLDTFIRDLPFGVEDPEGGGDGDHVGDRPPAKRPDGELHGIDRLQSLRSAGGADQADHLIV